MSDQLVNIPRDHFERFVAAPLEIARIEAAEMLRKGDTSGANARIAAGVEQAAQMRSQALAYQAPAPPPQPAATGPLAAAGSPLPHGTPRSTGEAMILEHKARVAKQRAELEAGGADPRFNPRLPWFGRPS